MLPPKGVRIQLTSYTFLFAFLPVTLLVYWLLPRTVWRLAFLVLASWVFVGWFDWRFVPIMVGATAIDWVAGLLLARTPPPPAGSLRPRRWILAVALLANVAILGYFKYRGFFLDSLDGFGSWVGLDLDLPALHVLLPLGISFYTFSAMSYVIDVYRGDVTATRSFLRYAAFIALFPRAIAGPILRWRDVEGDFEGGPRRLTTRLAALGLFFIACGMAKKLLIADVMLPHVDELFGNAAHLHLFSGWAAALGYTLQLYFDFSGYSDMAVGIAYLLGYHFPQNFDSPYKAANPSQFWRRWHMTLSFWLRDYVYIPLGGSRGGMGATVRNLMLTFLVAGIWHGAGWTFIVWGLLHGLYQSVHVVARKRGVTPEECVAEPPADVRGGGRGVGVLPCLDAGAGRPGAQSHGRPERPRQPVLGQDADRLRVHPAHLRRPRLGEPGAEHVGARREADLAVRHRVRPAAGSGHPGHGQAGRLRLRAVLKRRALENWKGPSSSWTEGPFCSKP